MTGTNWTPEFERWFDSNLVYCHDTHSFVHRLYFSKEKWLSYHDAQHKAFDIIKEMMKEFEESTGEKARHGPSSVLKTEWPK